MKKSVCFDRYFFDEENVLVFEKVKYIIYKMKYNFQKYNLVQFKKNDVNKLINFKIYIKEIEQCVQVYKIVGNEENCFLVVEKEFLNFLQCYKEKEDFGVCSDSFFFLCQRLKLRF